MLTNEEYAYIAGIIDGEGHIPDRDKKWGCEIIVSTTNRNLALFFRQKLGGRLKRIKGDKKRDLYRWFWRRSEFKEELINVYPYLIIKKENAKKWLRELMTDSSNSVETCSNANNTELSPTQIAYLAGIIDGEGCLTLKVCRHKDGGIIVHPLIVVVNTSKELFSFITNLIGGHPYWKKNLGSFKTNSLIGEYSIYSRKIKEILPLIEKYCIVKKPQIKVLKRFLALKESNVLRDKNTGRFIPVEEQYLLKTLKLSRMMSILNQKKSMLIGKV